MAKPLPETPVLDLLVPQMGALARRQGVESIVIVARDPQTGVAKVFGATEAMNDLRELVEEKFGFGGETAWNDT